MLYKANGDVNVDHIGSSSPKIDVNVIKAGGTGLTTIISGTDDKDIVKNEGTPV